MRKRTLLITGATGFLGSCLAEKYLDNGYGLKLLVRNRQRTPLKEIFSEIFSEKTMQKLNAFAGRVELIEGDISLENLGLPVDDYLRLADTVDEVLHCAAATKFENDRNDTLTQTNIYGSLRVARFCSIQKIKRFHYVSTAYVAGKRRGTVFETELENGQKFNNTYEQSKFEAEKRISSFAEQQGIPLTVYRPSIITGDSGTGFTRNYDNIYAFCRELVRLTTYETRMKLRDSSTLTEGKHADLPVSLRIPGDKHSTINLIPVDYAASAIFHISVQKETTGKTFHIVNPSPPTIEEIAEWLKVATGIYSVRIVPKHEFHITEPNTWEKNFLKKTETFQSYMFGEACFDSANTREFLAGSNIDCPLITQEFISRIIQYAIDAKWGKKGVIREYREIETNHNKTCNNGLVKSI
ncbi:MAG: SDR family oxidoreductase [Candidatus Kuenenia sp.]|nr:SDR family oxidoreductase [Candidatus Kuenenia hertensis]